MRWLVVVGLPAAGGFVDGVTQCGTWSACGWQTWLAF